MEELSKDMRGDKPSAQEYEGKSDEEKKKIDREEEDEGKDMQDRVEGDRKEKMEKNFQQKFLSLK